METETLLRFVAVGLAALILVSNVNVSFVLSYVKNLFKFKNVKTIVDTKNKNTDFLEIVSLWHTLKSKCETYGLNDATEKLNEVFPLLNMEENNDG
jgi:hypothetical protein